MKPAEYRDIRDQLRLTQAELADILGVHRNTIIRRENGTAPITLEAILAIRQMPTLRKRCVSTESEKP